MESLGRKAGVHGRQRKDAMERGEVLKDLVTDRIEGNLDS